MKYDEQKNSRLKQFENMLKNKERRKRQNKQQEKKLRKQNKYYLQYKLQIIIINMPLSLIIIMIRI